METTGLQLANSAIQRIFGQLVHFVADCQFSPAEKTLSSLIHGKKVGNYICPTPLARLFIDLMSPTSAGAKRTPPPSSGDLGKLDRFPIMAAAVCSIQQRPPWPITLCHFPKLYFYLKISFIDGVGLCCCPRNTRPRLGRFIGKIWTNFSFVDRFLPPRLNRWRLRVAFAKCIRPANKLAPVARAQGRRLIWNGNDVFRDRVFDHRYCFLRFWLLTHFEYFVRRQSFHVTRLDWTSAFCSVSKRLCKSS